MAEITLNAVSEASIEKEMRELHPTWIIFYKGRPIRMRDERSYFVEYKTAYQRVQYFYAYMYAVGLGSDMTTDQVKELNDKALEKAGEMVDDLLRKKVLEIKNITDMI